MKITDDMLTEEQRSAVEIALSLIGLSSDPRVQKAYKGLRSLLTARRTTPDRETIIEECAAICDEITKHHFPPQKISGFCASAIRAQKTAPTSDKGGA